MVTAPSPEEWQPRRVGERVVRAYRDVLAVPGARALIGASAASQTGNWLYNAALLGYVYSATHSAVWVGAATICKGLPYVLLGPFGGAIADRYPRRTVLLAGDLLRMLIMAAIAATVASAGPVALVIAFTALASAAGSAEKAAAMALLPRLVGEVRLGPANALLHTVQALGVVIGRRSERSCSQWPRPGSRLRRTARPSRSLRCWSRQSVPTALRPVACVRGCPAG